MENEKIETETLPKEEKVETKPIKIKKERKKMTDQQKTSLKKHMDSLDMGVSEKRSHRMKLMSHMMKGKTIKSAHKEIMNN
tara:strand:+ start:276 stop:518 length:243 start_codon:yes stop_codon:yes gene_type:complete